MDKLPQLRKRIDIIDDQILMALAERVEICKSIGTAKKEQGKPVKDNSRENQLYKRIKDKAVVLGLDSGQVEEVYREIVNMCSAVQE
jgi:chorismate mutase